MMTCIENTYIKMASFIDISSKQCLNNEIQGVLFRISTGEFGSPETFQECIKHLTNALSVCTVLEVSKTEEYDDGDNDKPSAPLTTDATTNVAATSASKTSASNSMWVCEQCTFENSHSNPICEMCSRTDQMALIEQYMNHVSIDDTNNIRGETKHDTYEWECIHCTYINNTPTNICHICQKTHDDMPIGLTGFGHNIDLDGEF